MGHVDRHSITALDNPDIQEPRYSLPAPSYGTVPSIRTNAQHGPRPQTYVGHTLHDPSRILVLNLPSSRNASGAACSPPLYQVAVTQPPDHYWRVNDHTWQRDFDLRTHSLTLALTRLLDSAQSVPSPLDGFITRPPDRLLRVLDNPSHYPPNPLPGRDLSYGSQSDVSVLAQASDWPHQYMYVHQTADFSLSLKSCQSHPIN